MRAATPYKRPTSSISYILSANSLSSADIVILDDSKSFVEVLSDFLKSRGIKKIDTYCSPNDFLQNLSRYSTETKIVTDNSFDNGVKGDDLVKQLFKKGFRSFCVLSGLVNKELRSTYPDGTVFIEKGHSDCIDKLISWCKK